MSRFFQQSTQFVLFLILSILAVTTHADILWNTCEGPADNPTIVEGNFYNVCIKDHEFEDESHQWTLTNTTISETKFTKCTFSNTREKTSNFTYATWSNVIFKECFFGGYNGEPMTFDETSMTNVVFDDCLFHGSADLLFSGFIMNNVTFRNCRFEGETTFELGQLNQLNIFDSKIRRSSTDNVGSDKESFRFQDVTISGMDVVDSKFVNPIRFEGVQGADIAFNDTSFNQFWCHSKEDKNGKVEKYSGFNQTSFQKCTFNDVMHCDQTTWFGMFMGNVTYHADADFSSSKVLDLYWDGFEMKSISGECLQLNFSRSEIKRRVLANTTGCDMNFEDTSFETVLVKNVRGSKPRFTDAEFINQEYIDGECCTTACESLRCKCTVDRPSGQCPEGGAGVNTSAVETCFPSDSIVTSLDGRIIRMEDLELSEKIAIGAGEHSDVFFFGHRSADHESNFISIKYESGEKPARLSPNHYLYVNGALATANTVRTGDYLRGPNGNDDLIVVKVSQEKARGLYAPTTLHGDLIVDGVVVSSYTNVIHPDLSHKLLHPLRLLYRYGFDSLVSRFTMFYQRSWDHVPRKLGLPRGPDTLRI